VSQQEAITAGLARAQERTMADPGTAVPNGNGTVKATREFQFIVAAGLGGSIVAQVAIITAMVQLPTAPPDWMWQLARDVLTHLGVLDVGLMGGLLGMAQQKRT
jgi:hypothetical protein